VTGAPSSGSIISRQVSMLTVSLFTSIFHALHEARRVQAQRTLNRYRHLTSRRREKWAQAPRSNGGRP
jgi:hypothetical protein